MGRGCYGWRHLSRTDLVLLSGNGVTTTVFESQAKARCGLRPSHKNPENTGLGLSANFEAFIGGRQVRSVHKVTWVKNLFLVARDVFEKQEK